MRSLFRKRDDSSGPVTDQLRDQKIDAVRRLAERFTYDLGLLIAGHPVGFEEYVEAEAARRLLVSVEPFLASGDAMRPNFGDYGELRIEGFFLSDEDPIHAVVEFDDQSIRETARGELIPIGKRRMRLSLVIDPFASQVRDFALAPAGR